MKKKQRLVCLVLFAFASYLSSEELTLETVVDTLHGNAITLEFKFYSQDSSTFNELTRKIKQNEPNFDDNGLQTLIMYYIGADLIVAFSETSLIDWLNKDEDTQTGWGLEFVPSYVYGVNSAWYSFYYIFYRKIKAGVERFDGYLTIYTEADNEVYELFANRL